MRKLLAATLVFTLAISLGALDLAAQESDSFYQVIKGKFIEGGWTFMSLVLVCLITQF
mgnify:FL=1